MGLCDGITIIAKNDEYTLNTMNTFFLCCESLIQLILLTLLQKYSVNTLHISLYCSKAVFSDNPSSSIVASILFFIVGPKIKLLP